MNNRAVINVCDKCFCIAHETQQECPGCGYIFQEFATTPEKYRKIWIEIFNLKYSPVFRFTVRDHLMDCFECLCWWIKPRRETVPSPFSQAMISLFADKVAPENFLTPIFSSFMDNDEKVEIDIVRGSRNYLN